MSQRSPLARNITYNFLAQLWFLVLPLAVSPYFVHQLGLEKYGVLSLVTTVVGYLAVLDLGMGTATTKFLADHYVERDVSAISKVIGTSIVIYSALGVLGTLGIIALATTLIRHVLHVPPELTSETLTVFYISALGFLVNMPLTVFGAVPAALQRFDILVKQNLAFGTTTVASQVLLLALGHSLEALVLASVVISALGIAVFVVISRRLLPGVSFRPRFDASAARQVLSFSVLKVFSTLSGQVVFQLDRLLIASFLPLASVSYYAIPLALAQKIIFVVPNITTAVFPAISQFRLRENGVPDLYVRVLKMVALLVLPMTVVLVVFAKPILTLWMGAEVAAHSSAALRVLAVAFLVVSYAAVPGTFVEALGRPGIPAFFATVSAVVNLSITLLLIPRVGILGPAIALLVNGVITVPLFLDRAHRKVLQIKNWTVIRQGILRPLLAASLLFLFCSALSRYAIGLVGLGVVVGTGGILFVLLCFGLGVVDPVERKMIMEYLNTRLLRGKGNAA